MSDENRRILDLLAQGKLTVDEADQLLRAVSATASTTAAASDSATASAGSATDSATTSAPGSGSSSPKQESKAGAGEPSQPRYLRIAVKRARPWWADPKDARKDAAGANWNKAHAWSGDMGGSFPQKEVTIRVPIALVKSGMRLGAIIPGVAAEQIAAKLRERGVDVDLSKLDPASIDAILKDLGEIDIDVDHGNAQVHISCE
ncbi:MAG TPA: hypothetical protein VNZ26_28705 [Vicinamibacterales bacterium]|jgi:hypothetical protein|nr:hypothetical protein [Vicinamibacterales bacterium]